MVVGQTHLSYGGANGEGGWEGGQPVVREDQLGQLKKKGQVIWELGHLVMGQVCHVQIGERTSFKRENLILGVVDENFVGQIEELKVVEFLQFDGNNRELFVGQVQNHQFGCNPVKTFGQGERYQLLGNFYD